MATRTVTVVSTTPQGTWLYVNQNTEHLAKVKTYTDAGKLTINNTKSTVMADADEIHPLRKGQLLNKTVSVLTWTDIAAYEEFTAWKESSGHAAAIIEYNGPRGVQVILESIVDS